MTYCTKLTQQLNNVIKARDKARNAINLAKKEGEKQFSNVNSAFTNLQNQLDVFKELYNNSFETLPDGRKIFGPNYEVLKGIADETMIDINKLLKDKIEISEKGMIIKVNLSSCNLKEIPVLISKLTNLKDFNLADNQLTEPPDVSKLINLEWFNLHNNQLTEPPDVSKLINLETLFLDNNELIEPPDVSKLINLRHFGLNYNKLTEPPDVSKSINLKILYLSNNKLIEPPDVSKSTNLIYLDIENNPCLYDPITQEIIRKLVEKGVKVITE